MQRRQVRVGKGAAARNGYPDIDLPETISNGPPGGAFRSRFSAVELVRRRAATLPETGREAEILRCVPRRKASPQSLDALLARRMYTFRIRRPGSVRSLQRSDGTGLAHGFWMDWLAGPGPGVMRPGTALPAEALSTGQGRPLQGQYVPGRSARPPSCHAAPARAPAFGTGPGAAISPDGCVSLAVKRCAPMAALFGGRFNCKFLPGSLTYPLRETVFKRSPPACLQPEFTLPLERQPVCFSYSSSAFSRTFRFSTRSTRLQIPQPKNPSG